MKKQEHRSTRIRSNPGQGAVDLLLSCNSCYVERNDDNPPSITQPKVSAEFPPVSPPPDLEILGVSAIYKLNRELRERQIPCVCVSVD